MKRVFIITYIVIISVILVACGGEKDQNNLKRVGMILEDSIDSNLWSIKGYEGLQNIKDELNVDVLYEERVTLNHEIISVVDDFVRRGVNLIFGHSHDYGRTFVELSQKYPDVHFVYFNGGYFNEQVTSVNFDTHAMGFFSGMIAGKMTQTNEVGIIAENEWQSEIEGFYEGVKYQNPDANIKINVINQRTQENLALDMYQDMRSEHMDVIYPVSDLFSERIIETATDDGIYSIGYVAEPLETDSLVLTSTIQHIERLYPHVAKIFNEGQLEGGLLSFDFQSGAITLGRFHPDIPKDYQQLILGLLEAYMETNLLPYES